MDYFSKMIKKKRFALLLVVLISGYCYGQTHDQYETPMMGWASWNNYRINISEEIIRSQADAMVELGLDTLGYQYINIDDGFFGGRDKNGNLIAHAKRFPSGMLELSDYIHSKGLKAGIYSDAGINTCASYWDKDTIGYGMGLYGNDKRDLATLLVDWNYDFIKVDWCGGDWLGLDEQIRYTQIADCIAQIKPEAKYNICRWQFPGEWAVSMADSWRISGDIANEFNSVLHIIDLNCDLWPYCSPGHYNDMDMLQVGRGMSFEEDKAHFSMWCMMSSPLILGNDLTTIDKQTLDIISNKDLIAINQNPYAYQARKVKDDGAQEVFARPLFSTTDGQVAVALLNREKKKNKIAFKLSDVGIDSSKGYTIKDLWTKKEYQQSNDIEKIFTVAKNGVVVLLIEGVALPNNVYQNK